MIRKLLRLISRLVAPPKAYYEDFYEEARYILAYRMNLFLMISLAILGVILFRYYSPKDSIMTFTGLASVIVCLWYIRKTGKYKSFTLFFNLFGALLCQLTLFGITDQPHLIDGLWMIINILFAFLTLHRRWAIFLSLTHGISLAVFYYFFFQDQIPLIRMITPEQLIGLSVNVLICFLIILYLSWQNIRTNQYARQHLNAAKEELQRQFDTIHKQNEEKTVLLKEIHHRVKNNLQVITSLLRLQSRELENAEAISKFRDTTNRVIAMSMIHEKMYQSEELSRINLEEYFNSLADDLLSSYQVGFPIEISIQCSVEALGMRPIVPLALIFNELFSNSLKYAFDETEDPHIDVELIRSEDGRFLLTYTDNGTWKVPQRPDSFGLELISALTEQLEGKMEFRCTPATLYTFEFRNLDK